LPNIYKMMTKLIEKILNLSAYFAYYLGIIFKYLNITIIIKK